MSSFSKAVLLFDGDDAGREATADSASRLMRRMFVKAIYLAEGVQADHLLPEDLQPIIGSF